ncbi:hypothetical protein EDD22DRAFT_969089 [Suillus occidentalis]|nr:hypothetical protein EDD22DRAFT_969089 [Suillus occidentalis]
MRRPQHGGKIANNRPTLVFYVIITFVLRTLSISVNAKYMEMIWIDLRNALGGHFHPRTSIAKASSSGHIQEWFMQALLLHRCFAIWNWAKYVTIPMIILYLAMIGLSVYIQVEASTGIAFYDINIEPAYLGIQVGLNVIYTILVAYRLLDMQRKMKELVEQYDSRLYDTLVLIVVESVMAYTIFAIVFIVAFAMHLNAITTICFLSIGQVQGIAQLIIIIRVATGRSYAHGYWSTRPAGVPTTVAFAEEEPTDGYIARL